MLERRAAARPRAVPGPALVPDGPAPPGLPAAAVPGSPGVLLSAARAAATEYEASHGRPVTRDELRARLGISNQAASDLPRQLRAASATPRADAP
jgi:hypothetical protein